MRKTQFAEGEYYHIFNRGVDKRIIFSNQREMQRFFQSMCEFNTINPLGGLYASSFNQLRSSASKKASKERLVNFICYCLNPNHYHFILEQVADKGIEKFIHRLATGYTKYFNAKHRRSGVLFQGKYKAVHMDSNEQLLHVSAYVNLNFRVHQLRSSASNTVRSLSSWDEYIGKTKFNFCKKDDVLGQFKNKSEYKKFAEKTLTAILERKEILRELEE
jgi:REP element-mobilizing transposase RayT